MLYTYNTIINKKNHALLGKDVSVNKKIKCQIMLNVIFNYTSVCHDRQNTYQN